MNWSKNKLIDRLKSQIIAYNPIRDVSRILGDSCLVLSSNMDQMINDSKVTFQRRMKYYATFVIHLLVMIKYAILATYNDTYTIAMFGESFHVVTNIYYCSRVCLSFLSVAIPIKFTLLCFDDEFVTNMLLTISLFQTTLPFIRINNRKKSTKLWLMSKLYTEFRFPLKSIVFPATMFYCSTLAYTNSPIPVYPVTLAINSIMHCMWMTNVFEIAYFCGVCFFLTMSMALLRYKEIIHLIRSNKVADFKKVSHLYNQLVVDIKVCRRLFDPLIGIIYLAMPLLFGFVCQIIVDGFWVARVLAVIGLLVGCTSNYTMYYMASSICPMNKVKLVIPIQFENRQKTRQMKLKIDSLIARLNKEFVGFYCLYAIKFTRKSFYQYILGISMTYFLVDGLVNTRQG